MSRSYCHYNEKKRIITVCYDYDHPTGTLKYGATIFTVSDGSKWDRKKNNSYALERLEKEPVIVSFGAPSENDVTDMGYYNYRRLETSIRKHLIPALGVKNNSDRSLTVDHINELKQFIFNPQLSPIEEEYNKEFLRSIENYTEMYLTKSDNCSDDTNSDNAALDYSVHNFIKYLYLLLLFVELFNVAYVVKQCNTY
jgi:hypothetical protein